MTYRDFVGFEIGFVFSKKEPQIARIQQIQDIHLAEMSEDGESIGFPWLCSGQALTHKGIRDDNLLVAADW